MAIIRKKELNEMGRKELEKKLAQLRRDLIKINAQIANKANPDNPGQVKEIKKTIARILTKLREKTKRGVN